MRSEDVRSWHVRECAGSVEVLAARVEAWEPHVDRGSQRARLREARAHLDRASELLRGAASAEVIDARTLAGWRR